MLGSDKWVVYVQCMDADTNINVQKVHVPVHAFRGKKKTLDIPLYLSHHTLLP